MPLRCEEVDLSALARQTVHRFESTTDRAPGHILRLDAEARVIGRWDRSRLEQVLSNLISNAVKYSPGGGEVRICVRETAGGAELVVRDQGAGIEESLKGRLFQPFVRGMAAEGSVPGTGLGLYIAAQAVAQHGGEIHVESAPGQGSTFVVFLPLQPPA
jgi:signal transduction histidine kinase